jgi:hypothetical protein
MLTGNARVAAVSCAIPAPRRSEAAKWGRPASRMVDSGALEGSAIDAVSLGAGAVVVGTLSVVRGHEMDTDVDKMAAFAAPIAMSRQRSRVRWSQSECLSAAPAAALSVPGAHGVAHGASAITSTA